MMDRADDHGDEIGQSLGREEWHGICGKEPAEPRLKASSYLRDSAREELGPRDLPNSIE